MTTHSAPPLTWREGRRRQAWALAQAGWKQATIAAALGVTQGAVSQWLKRARAGGADALRAHPPPGPTPKLSAPQCTQLVALLTQGATAHGWHGNVWTTKRVAALIATHFGVHYHPAHVSRLLRRLGWSVQKPIVRATQRDADAVERWRTERWPAIKKKPSGAGGPSSG